MLSKQRKSQSKKRRLLHKRKAKMIILSQKNKNLRNKNEKPINLYVEA
jgi:hypothetical protein